MFKRRIRTWHLVALALIIGAILFRIIGGDGEKVPIYESATVARGVVERVVRVTGHIEPMERITLSFSAGGRVASMHVAEGDQVSRGEYIASLDTDNATAVLAEAEARVERERAVLQEIVAPMRSEAQAVEQATVVQAEATLASAEHSARTALAHAYALAHDAVLEKVDKLFTGGVTTPRFGIRFTSGSTDYLLQANAQTSSTMNAERAHITDLLAELAKRGKGVRPTSEELDTTALDLEAIDAFVTRVASAVNRYRPDSTDDQSVYDSFQTSVGSARTELATARAEIATVRASYLAAETARERAYNVLELSVAGATSEAVATQQAAIDVAMRAVDVARTRFSDSVLISPIKGTVAMVSPSVGESVGPLEPVIELLGDGVFEVEAYIPEADIADVFLGDPARITFDAFGEAEPLAGEVVRIALSETMREGVPTYKTTIVFTDVLPESMQLRPGMTADVDITTSMRQDVLFVPTRSVQSTDGRTYVRIPENDTLVERDIVTGVRGSEGTIEVVGGLSEGDEVVLYVDEAP